MAQTTTAELIGVDVGGTKIIAARSDRSLRILQQIVLPTPETYEGLLDAVSDLVRGLSHPGTVAVIGISCPGASDPFTRHIRSSNCAALKDRSFRDDLAMRLGREVVLENDANCFTLAEAVQSGHGDDALVLGVVISTGVGSGIVHRGQIIRGRHGLAGEWAHTVFPGPRTGEQRPCYCGNFDCTEVFLNGAALAAAYGSVGGRVPTAHDVGELADRGDGRALESLGRHATAAGLAVADLCNFLDPDLVIVGGGLGRRLGAMERFRDSLAQHLVNVSPRLLKTQLEDLGSVVGCQRLAWKAAS